MLVVPLGLDDGELARSLNACHTASGRHDVSVDTFVAHTLRPPSRGAAWRGDGADNIVSHTLSADGLSVAFAIGSHAGTADGESSNRSHLAGGPVGSNISEELAYSLRSGRRQSVATAGVRRLTPRECERLQGFPDDWTAVPFRGKPAADGPRYKAIGNSMAVPVMAWIGRRIQMVEDLDA